jgi:hypothetical protein
MKAALIVLLSLCLASTGCTTSRWVNLPQPPGESAPRVDIGEKVTLTMKSAARQRLKVAAVDANTLTGTTLDSPRGRLVQVSLADVETMTASRFSGGKTLGLAAGVVAGVLALWVAALYASVNTCEDCMGN